MRTPSGDKAGEWVLLSVNRTGSPPGETNGSSFTPASSVSCLGLRPSPFMILFHPFRLPRMSRRFCFGDGVGSLSHRHVFTAAGTYAVDLAVADDDGGFDIESAN